MVSFYHIVFFYEQTDHKVILSEAEGSLLRCFDFAQHDNMLYLRHNENKGREKLFGIVKSNRRVTLTLTA